MSEDTTIDVMVVDDHAVVRRGMTAFMEVLPDMRVIAEAGTVREAMAALSRADASGDLPHVVLMDLVLPETDGIEGISMIRARYPGVRVVAMTSFSEAERVQAALAAGAAGYLLKDAEPDEVAMAVRAARRGEVHLDPGVVGRLTGALTGSNTGVAGLSPREREVLKLVAEGLSNREIGRRLGISERTARTHVSNILPKIQVSSRTQAALFAVREGLVQPS